MLRNYLKTALRNMRKTPVLSLVTVIGLSAGLAFVFLIAAYIRGEWTVNAGMPDGDRLFILRSAWKDPGQGLDFTGPAPLAQALHEQYPGLVTGYYHHDGINSIVSRGDKKFVEGLQVGDDGFLRLFGFALLYGDPATALESPDKLVLTEQMALKYFGRKDVVGERLTLQSFSGSKRDFTIGGVLRDPPFNTVTYFGSAIQSNDFFLPASSLTFFNRDQAFINWNNIFIINYVRLAKGVSPMQVEAAAAQLLKANVSPAIQANLHIYLTSLHDYYLQSNGGLPRKMIGALTLIALFILLMAVINFVNMSLGNSLTRLREIGMRKVLGGRRTQLVTQFIAESTIVVAFATALSLLGYALLAPFFGDLLARPLPGLWSFPWYAWLVPIGLTLGIGCLAGLYPALVLSAQSSIGSLKGRMAGLGDKRTFRYTLLTLQFVSAIVVFVGALTIREQIAFFFHTDLGYKKDRIVSVTLPRDWSFAGVRRMEASRDVFLRNPQVEDASFSFEVPDGNAGSIGSNLFLAGRDSTSGLTGTALTVDERFASTYHIPLVAGTFFNAPHIDSTQFVLNESAVKALGFARPADAIGRQVRVPGNRQRFTIGGVIKDFHFESMRNAIGPLYMVHVRQAGVYRYLSLRLKPGDLPAQITALSREWTELFPDAPFNYTFLDDTLKTMYDTELRMDRAAQAATAVSLVIVLLGVFGIVSLSLTRRTKEVGIRKVLGATIPQVIGLFTREFLLLVGLANLIAWPIAYALLHRWLDQYVYRIDLNLVPFLLAGVGMAVVVSLLIAARAFGTASASPVKSLRTE
jgi:putative ABC transport system permease protein